MAPAQMARFRGNGPFATDPPAASHLSATTATPRRKTVRCRGNRSVPSMACMPSTPLAAHTLSLVRGIGTFPSPFPQTRIQMKRALSSAAAVAAAIQLVASANAQNCYENHAQCFSFAPAPSAVGRLEPGLNLRSESLSITGDFRLRVRVAETIAASPYNANDQQAGRARVKLNYQVNKNAKAIVEFNFSETWAGSEAYSDALVGVNKNGVSQAYVEVDEMFDVGDKWRVGRSEYILGNGLILGSCDYLQFPATFTGAWVSRKFWGHDIEGFVLDDYGPLQSPVPGTRYAGATGKLNLSENGPVESLGGFYMAGTRDGDGGTEDSWFGFEGKGTLPLELDWNGEWAQRNRMGADDVMAYRIRLERKFDCFVDSLSFTRTDSEGALHVNPADFNSAGLLHQYAGAWRSDLDTNQFGIGLRPGCDIDVDVTFLTLDRDGTAAQLGHSELDIVAGKLLKSGVHLGAGYGIDNDERQVGFMQMSLFF